MGDSVRARLRDLVVDDMAHDDPGATWLVTWRVTPPCDKLPHVIHSPRSPG